MTLPFRRGRRAIALACAVVGLAASLTACGGGSNAGTQSDTLTVALPTFEVDSPFPWEHNALGRAVFSTVSETLIQADPETGEYGPGLAESWEVDESGKTWTFTLREGIPFHGDWGDFTSADALYTFQRGQDPEATGNLAQVWATTLESVEAPDPQTFVVHLKRAQFDPYFFSSYGQTGIQSQRYIEEVGDDVARKEPIGTGPYQFVSGKPGEEYRFEAVKDHYRVEPAFKNLVIRRIQDATTAASALRAGEIDGTVVSGSTIDVLGDDVNLIEQEEGVANWLVFPETEPEGTDQYNPDLPWNASDPSDPAAVDRARKVREALNLGFNKEAVVDTIWKGYATADTPFGWYVAPWLEGYSDEFPSVPAYDPDRAKELLDEAGYGDGFTFPVVISQLQPDSELILPAMAQDLAKIGVTVEVTTMEHATLVGQLRTKSLASAFIYAIPGRVAQSSMVDMMSQNSVFRFLNTTPDLFDDAAAATVSAEAETAFVKEAVERLAEDFSTIPIGIQSTVVATSDKVGSWPLAGGIPFLHNLEYVQPAD